VSFDGLTGAVQDLDASDANAVAPDGAPCATGSTLCSGVFSCNDVGGSIQNQATTFTWSTALANGTYEIVSNAGYALDNPNGGGAGTGLDQWAYLGANQSWTLTNHGGWYSIQAPSGLALTGEGFNAQVQLQPYTGSSVQLFAFVPQGGSTYNIVNVGACLDLDDQGGGVQKPTSEWFLSPRGIDGNNGVWTVTPTSNVSGPVANGTYELVNATGYALDDPGGGGPGAVADAWAYMGANQQWTITNVIGNRYEITNVASGAALTQSSTGNTTMAPLAAYTGADDQLWVFWPMGGGYYSILDVGTNMAMDDFGGNIGVSVFQWGWQNDEVEIGVRTNTHQLWTLTPTSSISAPVANNIYALVDHAGYALDDPSGGGSGTVPDQVTYAGANQQWTVTNVSGMQYKIISNSGYALTSGASPGALSGLSSYSGANNQLWVFFCIPGTSCASYNIVNVGTNMALHQGSGASGSMVGQRTYGLDPAEVWSLVVE
jgi:hypothetical protein